MIKQLFITVLTAMLCNNVSVMAQSLANSNLESVSGPSLNASGSGSGGGVSVDKYTGKLQTGFPIYSYQNKSTGLSHSISVNYQGGGIHVDDIASDIGLGFSLNSGGMIVRAINGIPDEGVFNDSPAILLGYWHNATVDTTGSALSNYTGYMVDGQYDDFTYTAGSQSGSFHIGKDYTILQTPQTSVKIEQFLNGFQPSSAPADSCYNISWKITVPNGTQYIYSNNDCAQLNYNDTFSYHKNLYASSNWYLTKIIAPFDKDSVCFDYTPIVQSYMAGMSYSSYLVGGIIDGNPLIIDTVNVRSRDMRLMDIRYTDGTVVNFNYDAFYRLDIPSDNALNNITITNGTTSYGYKFNYYYMHNLSAGGADPSNPYTYMDYSSAPPSDVNQLDYRLVLSNYQQFANTDTIPGNTFLYYPSIPVSRGYLYNVDYWGFYTSGWVTRVPVPDDPSIGRAADIGSEYSSLQEIILPTGGNVKIQYENNDYEYNNSSTSTTYSIGSEYSTSSFPTEIIGFEGAFCSIYSGGTSDEALVHPSGFPSGDMQYVTFTISYVGSEWPTVPYHFHCLSMSLGINSYVDGVNTGIGSVVFDSIGFSVPKTVTILVPSSVTSFGFTFASAGEYFYPYVGPFGGSFNVSVVGYNAVTNVATTYDTSNIKVGGIRVSGIISSDTTGQNNQIVNTYTYTGDDGYSSGILGNMPVYNFGYSEYFASTSPDIIDFNYYTGKVISYPVPGTLYSYTVYTSQTENSIFYTHGNPVGYGKVEEYLGTPASFKQKTATYFTTEYSDTSGISGLFRTNFPYAPMPNLDFVAGLPLYTYSYNSSGLLLSKTQNQYSISLTPENTSNFLSVQAGVIYYPTGETKSNYRFQEYYPVSGYVFPASTTQTNYFAGNDSLVNTTQFTYDLARMVPIKTATTDSRGNPLVTYYYYPSDFASAGAIETLQMEGLIYFPIRSETWDNGFLVNASVYLFQLFSDGSVKPQSSFALTTTAPVSLATYGPFSSSVILQSPSLFSLLGSMDQFDSKGNLLQTTSKGQSSCTVWCYKKSIPVASVANAVISDVAYTSFEDNDADYGNWVASTAMMSGPSGFTGNYSCDLSGVAAGSSTSGTLTKGGLDPAKTYVVSFWLLSGTVPNVSLSTGSVALTSSDVHIGWTLYKGTFTGSTSVTIFSYPGLNTVIDELRLYPLGAAMSTATFNPLFGVTSKCDASNRTVYYEYDDFGRLKDQRDMDGNIIQKYDYATQAPQY